MGAEEPVDRMKQVDPRDAPQLIYHGYAIDANSEESVSPEVGRPDGVLPGPAESKCVALKMIPP